MSAARSRSPLPGAGSPAPRDVPAGRRWLGVTCVLALAWTTTLLFMDVTSARLQIVSRDQILKSDVVVIARRRAPESDRVRVERVFRGPAGEGDDLRILNLAEVRRIASDRDYVLALSRSRKDFVVTMLAGQRGPPLVYASSPAIIEEVKSILRDRQL